MIHLFFRNISMLLFGLILIWNSPLFAQTGYATSSVVLLNTTINIGEQIIVTININVSNVNPPDNHLGSFTGSLSWNPNVVEYIGDSGMQGGFAGFTNLSAGNINFNGANATGVTGSVNVLQITFEGHAGGTSPLELEYSAMAATETFANLLPILTISDDSITVLSHTGTDIGDLKNEKCPDEFFISQNRPNPFNPETKINYYLQKSVHVNMEIYNLLGCKVRTLVDEIQVAGNHEVVWDSKDGTGKFVTAGMYIYKITAGKFTEMKKMQFIK